MVFKNPQFHIFETVENIEQYVYEEDLSNYSFKFFVYIDDKILQSLKDSQKVKIIKK